MVHSRGKSRVQREVLTERDMCGTMIGMHTETLRIMASIERRLETVINLHLTACGHEDMVRKANLQEHRMMKWLERELDKLVGKAKP
jgi:hypothetical protein